MWLLKSLLVSQMLVLRLSLTSSVNTYIHKICQLDFNKKKMGVCPLQLMCNLIQEDAPPSC